MTGDSGGPVIQDALDLQELRNRLPGALVRSPLEFVPRIDVAADTAMFVDRVTRPLPAEDDLRLLHRRPSGAEVVVLAERLPWDSAFFGYHVARLDGVYPLHADRPQDWTGYAPALQALLEVATAKDITYLFTHVDARDTTTLEALRVAGFIQIEARVFYHRRLDADEGNERYDVRVATPADIESLSATARTTVNPHDRFHADPFITREDADRLMGKWVEASILEAFADVTIVPDTEVPTAFCTVRYHRDKWDRWRVRLSQPVFSAVGRDSRGWYRKLISEIHYHLKHIGAEHSYLTTQQQNTAVVRSWERLGYQYAKTECVLRAVLRPLPVPTR